MSAAVTTGISPDIILASSILRTTVYNTAYLNTWDTKATQKYDYVTSCTDYHMHGSKAPMASPNS